MPKTSDPQPLLLDTHVWLWLLQGNSRLRSAARSAIGRAASVGGLRIAAITVWEVALLSARGCIVLGQPMVPWIEEALTGSGVAVEPLSPRVAAESWELPDGFHADPADRVIVATARITNARLMTRDRRILDYAERGHLTAVSA